MLVEPFNIPPKTMDAKWDDFDEEYTLDDIKESINEQYFLNTPVPSYKVDISRDLKEYAAFQEIPNFGSHFYYAFSFEQLPKWQNFSKFKVEKKKVESLNTEDIEIPVVDQEVDEEATSE